MAEIIIIGHGSYPEGVRTNLEMVIGVPENMHFLNFSLGMERAELESRLDQLLEGFADREVLFCVDLPGATPFQVAALRTAEKPEKYCTVVGLNNMAFMEMAMDGSGSASELARRGMETTAQSIHIFP